VERERHDKNFEHYNLTQPTGIEPGALVVLGLKDEDAVSVVGRGNHVGPGS
jgi:hypothetical protein